MSKIYVTKGELGMVTDHLMEQDNKFMQDIGKAISLAVQSGLGHKEIKLVLNIKE